VWLEDEPWGVPLSGQEQLDDTSVRRQGQWFKAHVASVQQGDQWFKSIGDSKLPWEHMKGHTLPDYSLRLLTSTGITGSDMQHVQSCLTEADKAWQKVRLNSNTVQVSDFFGVMDTLASKEVKAFTKTARQQAYQGGSRLSLFVLFLSRPIRG
jgi:hypothetical protein